MVKKIKINGMADIQKLNAEATWFDGEVGIHTDNAIADAKSMLGLMSLDYSEPVMCVTEDARFYKRIKPLLIEA